MDRLGAIRVFAQVVESGSFAKAATRLGLRDRGFLREGYAADVTVFEPATVKDESTYPDPHRYPTGIPYVIVNGAVVVDEARMSGERTGRIIRR